MHEEKGRMEIIEKRKLLYVSGHYTKSFYRIFRD